MRDHGEAVEYDLLGRGLKLRQIGSWRLSWRELRTIVRQAQPDTATFKALNPRWQQTIDTELMRSAEVSLRWLVWAKTREGVSGRNMPEPFRWPWDEPEPKHDVMDWDEAAAFFGWEAEMGRYFDAGRDPGVDTHRAFPDPDVDTHRAFDD